MQYDLDDLLSEPTPELVEELGAVDGDIMVLGAGGKMGPTLSAMARRASEKAERKRKVIAVSRFSSEELPTWLEARGVETIRCDLLDREQVARLPAVPNVVFMAGRKFGSTGREELTWAMNTLVPAHVCEHFRESRIVAFSTGNVYGMAPVKNGGSLETDAPAPTGDYSMSCLGRERVFEYYSSLYGIPVALIRLNYACEPRYGVLVDLARKIRAGETIELFMGYFNVIWQGDANAMALRALPHASSPPLTLNVTGPELLRVRDVSEKLGELLGKPVTFRGKEYPDAYLSNASKAFGLFGRPRMRLEELLEMIVAWVQEGREHLGKPTHFEVRDGKF